MLIPISLSPLYITSIEYSAMNSHSILSDNYFLLPRPLKILFSFSAKLLLRANPTYKCQSKMSKPILFYSQHLNKELVGEKNTAHLSKRRNIYFKRHSYHDDVLISQILHLPIKSFFVVARALAASAHQERHFAARAYTPNRKRLAKTQAPCLPGWSLLHHAKV